MFSKPPGLGSLIASALISLGPAASSPSMTMYRARKVVCDSCGWITTRCQPVGQRSVDCGRCGMSLREKRAKPTAGKIRRFLDTVKLGGL